MRERVDLNNDGVFDADDILIFEGARGLPQELSTRIREATPRDRSHRPQTR
jgi:hypothetical protein